MVRFGLKGEEPAGRPSKTQGRPAVREGGLEFDSPGRALFLAEGF